MSANGSAEGPLLAVRNLTVRLPAGGDRPYAVQDLSFDLGHQEILCIVGESGSGKSVTAEAVLGLLPRSLAFESGRILFEGRDLLRCTPAELRAVRGRRISMIFQEPAAALDPVRTIGDQVAEAILAHERMPRAEVDRQVVERLAEMALPDPGSLRHTYPFRLSGGQQQRVMIAMALALRPSILVADEPTTALDVTTQAQILELICGLQARHRMSVLFITHDIGVVSDIADRMVVMRHGRMVECGRAQDILRGAQHDYTRKLIAAVPRMAPPERAAPAEDPALRAENLRKTFRGHAAGLFRRRPPVRAVDDVSFSLSRGETLGIVGESGSGKSTVARCLVRLTELDGGKVDIGGIAFSSCSGRALRRERRRIQIIFQDPFASLNPRQTVETIVGAALRVQGVSAARARERSLAVLSLVGLDESALARYPHEFSGGQRQRIGIARALAPEPDILIADEAVSSLDVSIQAQVLDLLAAIQRRLRLAMLFITHDLRVAAAVSDRILVMKAGRVVEEGRTREVFSRPQHPYTRALLAALPGRAWLAEGGPAAGDAEAGAPEQEARA